MCHMDMCDGPKHYVTCLLHAPHPLNSDINSDSGTGSEGVGVEALEAACRRHFAKIPNSLPYIRVFIRLVG